MKIVQIRGFSGPYWDTFHVALLLRFFFDCTPSSTKLLYFFPEFASGKSIKTSVLLKQKYKYHGLLIENITFYSFFNDVVLTAAFDFSKGKATTKIWDKKLIIIASVNALVRRAIFISFEAIDPKV